MRLKLVLLVIAIFLLVSTVIAETDYTEVGDADTSFIRGNGIFNSQLDPNTDVVITGTLVVSDPKKVPLISDLDNDGNFEIIILSGTSLSILQNKTLDVADTFSLNVTPTERFSNIIIFDIDGDNLNEIILVAEKKAHLIILEYNNSRVTLQKDFNFTEQGLTVFVDQRSASVSGLHTLACESTERCLVAYGNRQDTGSGTNLFASFFNSSFLGHETQIDTAPSGETFCTPKIRLMERGDYDQDSDVEFMFVYASYTETATDDEVNVYWLNVEDNHSVTEELQVTTTEVGGILEDSGPDLFCDITNTQPLFTSTGGSGLAIPEKFFTAPLVFDADPSSAGLETIIGVMTDNNEFIMIMYDSSATEIREFPLIQESEGQLISNVFRAEIFDDSASETDFCVFAQQSTDEQLSLTCGSLQDGDGFGIGNLQTIEFRLENFNEYNVSHDFDEFQIITHSIETDSTNSEDEILTSFGVLGISLTGCGILNNCDMSLIFNNPIQDGAVISTDLEETNLEDLLIMTSTNLFYLNDGFENSPATISAFTTNPCIDSVWKINTTVEITVTGSDINNDNVAVRAILYSGDSNEQDSGFSANVSSGTTVPFNFVANKSIGAGTLRMEAKDVENQETVDVIERSFSVANTGVEFNDCVTSQSFVVEEEVEAVLNASLTVDATDNAVIRGINGISGISNLAGTTIWLLIMLFTTIFIWFEVVQRGMSGNSALGTIAIANALFIILGARLGILSTALVVIVVLLGVVILGVFVGRFFTGISTGGNGNA